MTSTGPTITAGITTKHSPLSIEDTVTRLAELIADRGMKVFDVIDQSAEARSVGLLVHDREEGLQIVSDGSQRVGP